MEKTEEMVMTEGKVLRDPLVQLVLLDKLVRWVREDNEELMVPPVQ